MGMYPLMLGFKSYLSLFPLFLLTTIIFENE